jgi:hypothetical protein
MSVAKISATATDRRYRKPRGEIRAACFFVNRH